MCLESVAKEYLEKLGKYDPAVTSAERLDERLEECVRHIGTYHSYIGRYLASFYETASKDEEHTDEALMLNLAHELYNNLKAAEKNIRRFKEKIKEQLPKDRLSQ